MNKTIASMTVKTKGGQRHSANNLQIMHKSWGDFNTIVLVFECSDVLTIFPVEDVDSIELNRVEVEVR